MLHILVANVGSTSLKYKLVAVQNEEYHTLAFGSIERIGLSGATAVVEHIRPDAQGYMHAFTSEVVEPSYASAIDLMLRSLTEAPPGVLSDLSLLDAVAFT